MNTILTKVITYYNYTGFVDRGRDLNTCLNGMTCTEGTALSISQPAKKGRKKAGVPTLVLPCDLAKLGEKCEVDLKCTRVNQTWLA